MVLGLRRTNTSITEPQSMSAPPLQANQKPGPPVNASDPPAGVSGIAIVSASALVSVVMIAVQWKAGSIR